MRRRLHAEESPLDFPWAEWDKAGVILMHTPGHELFNGVIHPSAALFEDYFDVDEAAAEHRGYIKMLEKNGIRVYTVEGILNEVGIDSLRILADNVLTFDISEIPDEDPEATEAYRQEVLSKLNRSDLIRCILLQPTVRLMKTESNTGYDAEYVQNPLMNLYFTRDHKLWQMQMHLDTYFNIIDRDLCTMVTSRLEAKPGEPEYGTCDIWARKPGTKSYELTVRDEPFVDYLHDRGFRIIPIDYDDEMHYANNFLTIAPRHIMAVGGQSEELQRRFREAGVKVEWIPLENLIGGYRAAHCMTQVLRREKE